MEVCTFICFQVVKEPVFVFVLFSSRSASFSSSKLMSVFSIKVSLSSKGAPTNALPRAITKVLNSLACHGNGRCCNVNSIDCFEAW